MKIEREDLVDLTLAVEKLASVAGVYALPPRDDSHAYAVMIVLSPYTVPNIVEVHYALVTAARDRSILSRVRLAEATSLRGEEQRIVLTTEERERGRQREADRPPPEPEELAALATELRQRIERDATEVGERRRRVLVVDEDPITAKRIGELSDVDVIEVEDGWSAVDRLKEGDIDLAVCAVKIGEFSGAKIHKLVATANPKMARRIVYLATETALSQAPPSSASGRLLARPISAEAVRSLLDTLGPVG